MTTHEYFLGPGERFAYPPAAWQRAIPTDCPVGVSDALRSVGMTGTAIRYTKADTWFPSWAADGAMYSPFTDGMVGPWASNSKGVCAMTGAARIDGDDPLNLKIVPLSTEMESPGPFVGRYPGASLVYRGRWHYGTYLVHEERAPDGRMRDLLGPFVGFRASDDFGATWTPSPHPATATIFGEAIGERPIKIGSPRFVDFGQELAHSPDGRAYMVAFGALPGYGHLNWILGDAIFLGRVDPATGELNDAGKWEWFAGDGWAPGVERAEPIFTWPRSVGQLSMTYLPGVRRYVMCVSYARKDAVPTVSYILESEKITGPWRIAGYWDGFGAQAYFLNFPSRFLSDDGADGWLCYSANHTDYYQGTRTIPENPVGSRYALCLHRARLEWL